MIVLANACTTTSPVEEPPPLQPADLLIKDHHAPPTSPLTQAQVDKDLRYLSYALNHGYGGRNVQGEALKRALDQLTKVKAPVSAVAFKDDIDRALLKIPDNHLHARLDGTKSPERQATFKQGRVGKNAIADPGHIWEVSLKRGVGEEYLYVAISRFPSSKDPIWQGFLDAVKEKMAESAYLVLDLRGNGGGDDSKGIELAIVLHGGSLRYPIARQYRSQTPESLVVWGNLFRLQKLMGAEHGVAIPPYVDELIKESDEKYTMALSGELPPERIDEEEFKAKAFDSTRGYDKPIYILMDGECASSCESTIDAFEFHPHVKKVGENTGGFIHFGNVGLVILPESRVEVQIPTHYNEYFDKRFLDRVGIKPDRRVPAGTDALEYVVYKLHGSKPKK